MSNEEIIAMAEKSARAMADRMVAAYVKSVSNSVTDYGDGDEQCLPDEDDVFAWLEGYDWS